MSAMSQTAESAAAAVIESRNPATHEVIGTVPVDGPKVVAEKVARARQAAQVWGQLGFARRREELFRWRREIASRTDDFVDLVHRENGKPLLDSLQEVMVALSHLDHAAKRASTALAPHKVSAGVMANFRASVSYHPLGVIGVIGPWNYPLITPMGSIAYALAAGNAVVFKPSELTSLVALLLEETAKAALSVPDVFVVTTGRGQTGAALAGGGVDKVSFTGSTATGRKVMEAAAKNLTPVLLELGGKDAMIIAEDANIDEAAESAVWGSMTNAGQTCISVERCYVVSSVYDRFLDKVVEEIQGINAGATSDAKIGAITSPEQVDIIRDHIEDAVAKGAKVLVGGADKIRDSFVEPTVLVDVTDKMKVMREETFGPVLPIQRLDSVEEAIQAANSTPYGLGSSVYGKKGVRALADRMVAGMTAINSVLSFSAIPSLPFGGVGDSGIGRIHGDEGLREFSRCKAISEKRVSIPMNLMSFRLPDNIYDRLRSMIDQLYGGGVVDRATSAWAAIKDRGLF